LRHAWENSNGADFYSHSEAVLKNALSNVKAVYGDHSIIENEVF